MVDNVPITPGTGADIATDEVAGVHLQRIKLDLGGDGLSVPVVDSLPTNDDAAATILADIQTAAEAIQASATAINADTTAIETAVDGLETAVASTNTKLDTVNTNLGTIDGRVDGLETLQTSANTKLDTLHTDLGAIDGHVDGIEASVDGIEALITTGNASLVTIDGRVDGLETIDTAIQTSVQIMDDWDESDRAKVNPIVGQAGIAAGTGTDGVTVPRVTLATNVGLPAGTNNIGDVDVLTLPALPAGSNNIGDVDVLTVPADPFGANADAVVAAGAVGSIQAKLRRLTTDLDTVSTTATAIKTAVEIMDDWDESDRAKVNLIAAQAGVDGNSGNVSAKTLRTVLATDVALPAGTNAIGKLAANNGVDIGDVDVLSVVPGTAATNLGKAEDAQHTTGDVGVMALGVRSAAPSERSAGPTDGDYEPFATNEVGALWTSDAASANGGASTMNATSGDGSTALTNSAQVISANPGSLYGYYIWNPNSVVEYVMFYNTAAASVTVGTTNPLFILAIPPASAANLFGAPGILFSTAMSWAASSTAATSVAPTVALDAVAWYK